jgi:tetratricopeptide (TPR) repeat protein
MQPILPNKPRHPWGPRESAILFYIEKGNYAEALSLFSGITRDLEPDLLISRADCLFRQGNYPQVLELLQTAERQEWIHPDLFSLKGRALYSLEEYASAKVAFEMSNRCRPDWETQRWIRRCAVKIELANGGGSGRVVHVDRSVPAVGPIRHEWHQTAANLTLSLFVRNLRESQLRIDLKTTWIHILVDDTPPLELSVGLTKPIVLRKPIITITPMKGELKFVKAVGAVGQWPDIEAASYLINCI